MKCEICGKEVDIDDLDAEGELYFMVENGVVCKGSCSEQYDKFFLG